MTDWREDVTWYTGDTFVGELVKAILRPLYWATSHISIEGVENFPLNGPCIVAANHLSLYDIITVGLALPRHPHFMSKQELFKNPVMGWTIRRGGSFPVYRGEGDAWALKQAGQVLVDGSVLFMFPEGTRNKKAQLKRGKVGVAKLALEYGAPIVPTAVWGTENFKIGWKRNNINIRFGEPLDAAAIVGPPPHKHDAPRVVTNVMMKEIAALLPEKYRGFYAESESDA